MLSSLIGLKGKVIHVIIAKLFSRFSISGSQIRFPGPSGYSHNYQHLEKLGKNQLQPPNQLHLVGFQPVTFQNYQQQPSALLLGMPAPQQQFYSLIHNQHKNPVVVHQSAKPQPLPAPLPAIIPSHYLLSNIQQPSVVNPMHLVLVASAPQPPPGYQQQQIVNLPMKPEEYEFSPDTTKKQEESSHYNLPSIDVNEILFYPDKVLTKSSFIPSGSESFKPLQAAY